MASVVIKHQESNEPQNEKFAKKARIFVERPALTNTYEERVIRAVRRPCDRLGDLPLLVFFTFSGQQGATEAARVEPKNSQKKTRKVQKHSPGNRLNN